MTALSLFLFGATAHAECNPSFDQECLGNNDGRGPEISINPDGQTYDIDGGTNLDVPVSIAISDADGVDQSSLSLSLISSSATTPVGVLTYRASAAGAGALATTTVRLTTAGDNSLMVTVRDRFGNASTGRATLKVTVRDPDLPIVYTDVHHNDYRDVSRAQIALSYSLPSYTSMSVERAAGLFYTSELASPTAFVQVDAMPDPRSGSRVVAMSLKVIDVATNAVVSTTREYFWKKGMANRQRMGAFWSMNKRPTGAYNYIAVVRSHFNDGTSKERREPLRVLVVNEADSRYGAGWILAGVQRVYGVANGLIVSEGDGVTRWFATGSCDSERCSMKTPEGDFTKLTYEKASDTLLRVYADGSGVRFKSNGLMAAAIDRFGRTTTYNWQDSPGPSPVPVLSSIVDPMGMVTSFTYSPSGYLDRIVEPGGRATTLRYSGTDLVELAGATTLRVAYDEIHNATSYTDQAGTWSVSYYRGTISSIAAPAITARGTLVIPNTKYQTAERLVALPAESGTGLDNLAEALPSDAAVARIVDPEGHTTAMLTNRYGQPLTVRQGADTPAEIVTRYTWTKDGLPASMTEPGDVVTMYTWDARGQLLTKNVADSTVYVASYGLQGLEFEFSGQEATWYAYGSAGEVVRTWHGSKANSTVNATTYEYDARFRLIRHTAPTGIRTEWGYAGNPWGNADFARNVLADGTVVNSSFTYDSAGRLRSATNTLDQTMTYTYDSRNRVIEQRSAPLQLVTRSEYQGGSLTKVIDAAGKVYGFSYNALGWRESETFPDGTSRTYTYDRDGQIVKATDRRGSTFLQQMSYDAAHRPLTLTAGGATTSYAYPDNSISTATNAEGTVTAVVSQGHLDRISSSFSGLSGRLYDVKSVVSYDAGWRPLGTDVIGYLNGVAQFTRSIRRSTNASATGGGNEMAIVDPTGRTTTLYYDQVGRHVQTTFPVGISQINQFNADGQLLATSFNRRVVNDALGTLFGYDVLGRLTYRFNETTKVKSTYGYDSAGRLAFDESSRLGPVFGCNPSYEYCTDEWFTTGSRNYTYDSASNRTGGQITLQPNSNRYATFDGYTLEYDLEGNLTRKYKSGYDQRLAWNALGQLTSVVTNGVTVTYGYDALNRRVRRTANGQSRYFVYDGDDLILELDGSGQAVKTFTHLPGTDRPLSLLSSENGIESVYYYVMEWPGSVRAVLNSSGNVTAEYRYTPFGEVESGNSSVQPFRFMGRELDSATGLYYVRNRWYDPELGRFATEDPIGMAGGLNTYAYAGNDPVNNTDPSGLSPCKSTIYISLYDFQHLENLEESMEEWVASGTCVNVVYPLDTLFVVGHPTATIPDPSGMGTLPIPQPARRPQAPSSTIGPPTSDPFGLMAAERRDTCQFFRRQALIWGLFESLGDVYGGSAEARGNPSYRVGVNVLTSQGSHFGSAQISVSHGNTARFDSNWGTSMGNSYSSNAADMAAVACRGVTF